MISNICNKAHRLFLQIILFSKIKLSINWRKFVTYIVLYAHIVTSAAFARGPLYIFDEELPPPVALSFSDSQMTVVAPTVKIDEATHNILGNTAIFDDGGVVFKAAPDSRIIYNRFYGDQPIYIGGTVATEQVDMTTVFASPNGLVLENPNFHNIRTMSLIAGGVGRTERGVAYGVNQGFLDLTRVVMKADEDVKQLSMAGRAIHIEKSIVAPEEQIDIRVGQHIKVMADTNEETPISPVSNKQFNSDLILDESSILQSKKILIQGYEDQTNIYANGMLHSTHEDIVIHARGDVYINKMFSARNLHIYTEGKVYFGDQAFVKGNVNVKASSIHVAHQLQIGGEISLESTQLMQIDGAISSQGKINFLGQGGIRLRGAVASQSSVVLNSSNDIFQEGSLYATGGLVVNGKNFIKRGHILTEGELNVTSQANIDLQSGELISLKQATLLTSQGKILNLGRISSEDKILLRAISISNFGHLESKDILDIEGTFVNYFAGQIKVKALTALSKVLSENRGTIKLTDSLKIAGEFPLKGIIKTKGTLELEGDVTLEGSLTAKQGAIFNMNRFTNKGTLTVAGEGVRGTITNLVNKGGIELAGANLRIMDGKNEGTIRTKGHFLLQGKNFTNLKNGLVFTCGVHQVNIEDTYQDHGFLYTPTLFLVRGSILKFSDSHRAYLREGILEATSNVMIQEDAEFQLESQQKCSLNLLSQGNIDFAGKINLRSEQYPLLDYFYGNKEYQKRAKIQSLTEKNLPVTYQDFEYDLRYLPRELWTNIRRKLGSGLTMSAGRDVTYKGDAQLDYSSIRFSAKRSINMPNGQIKAGYFQGNDISLEAADAYLSRSNVAAPSGSIVLDSKKKADIIQSKMDADSSIDVSADTLNVYQSQFITRGGENLTSSQSKGLLKLNFLEEFFKDAFDSSKAILVAKPQKSIGKSLSLPGIKNKSDTIPKDVLNSQETSEIYSSLPATSHPSVPKQPILVKSPPQQQSGIRLVGREKGVVSSSNIQSATTASILGGQHLEVSHSQLGAESTQAHSDNLLILNDNDLKGKQHTATARNVKASNNRSNGRMVFEAQQNAKIEDHQGEVVVVKAKEKVSLNGKIDSEQLDVTSKQVKNKAHVNATDSVSMTAETLDQRNKIEAVNNVTIHTTHYKDTQESLLRAGKVVHLKALQNNGFEGKIQSDKAVIELQSMRLQKLLSQVTARHTDAHLANEIVVNQDLVIQNTLHLWAKSLTNKAQITANGDFMAHIQGAILNEGRLAVHGTGSFFTGSSFVNKGKLTTNQNLLVKARSIYNNNLMMAGEHASFEGKERVENYDTMQGQKGLSVKTEGKFTHKGTVNGGEGLLAVEAESIDADATVETYSSESTPDPRVKITTTGQKVHHSKFAGTQLQIQTKKGISATGAELDIKQDATIEAGGRVNFDAVAYQAEQYQFAVDFGFAKVTGTTDPRTKHHVSKMNVGGILVVKTPEMVSAKGIQANVGKDITIQGDKGVDVSSLASVYVAERKSWNTGLFGQNRHERVREDVDFYQSSLNSKNGGICILANAGAITGIGTAFDASREVDLRARDTIDLRALKVTLSEYQYDEDKFLCFGSSDEKHIKSQQARVMNARSRQAIIVHSEKGTIEGEGVILRAPQANLHGEKGINLNPLELQASEKHSHIENNLNLSPTAVEVEHKERTTKTNQTQQSAGAILADKLTITTGKQAKASIVSNITGDREGGKTDIEADTDELVFMGTKSTYDRTTDSWSISVSMSVNMTPGGGFDISHDKLSQTMYGATVQNFGKFHNKRKGAKVIVQGGAQTSIEETTGEDMEVTEDRNALDREAQEGFSVGAKISSTGGGAHFSAKGGEKVSQDTLTSLRIGKSSNNVKRTNVTHDDQVKDTRWGVGVGFYASDQGTSATLDVQSGDKKMGVTAPLDSKAVQKMNPVEGFKDFNPTNIDSLNAAATSLSQGAQNLDRLGLNTGVIGKGLQVTQQATGLASEITSSQEGKEASTLQQAGKIADIAVSANQAARQLGIDTGKLGEVLDDTGKAVKTASTLESLGKGFSEQFKKHNEVTRSSSIARQNSGTGVVASGPSDSSPSVGDDNEEETEVGLGISGEEEPDLESIPDSEIKKRQPKKVAKPSSKTHLKKSQKATEAKRTPAAVGPSDETKDQSKTTYDREAHPKIVEEEEGLEEIDLSVLLPGMGVIRGARTLKSAAKIVGKAAVSYAASKVNKLPEKAGEVCSEAAENVADFLGASPEAKKMAAATAGFLCSEAASTATSVIAQKMTPSVANVSKQNKHTQSHNASSNTPNSSQKDKATASNYKEPALSDYKKKYQVTPSRENPPIQTASLEEARNKALEKIGEIDSKTWSVSKGEVGGGKGKANGFKTTVDGVTKTYQVHPKDKRKGPHIHVILEKGEELIENQPFTFPASDAQVDTYLKNLDKLHKKR